MKLEFTKSKRKLKDIRLTNCVDIMPKVLNNHQLKWNIPDNAVYVGRPSKWGNPYNVAEYGRRNAIKLYKIWLHESENSPIAYLDELKGKDLVCWCAPSPCHADYLLELANR